MRRLIVGLVLAGCLHMHPARADDAADVRAVITGQMQAFRHGDAVNAYGFAAPSIQTIFPSPERFMSMVMQGYAPVYQANDVAFGPLTTEGGALRQDTFITDREGRSWIASYTLERQSDGSLKITSCAIRRGNDVSA